MAAMTDISVVICTRNRANSLESTLDCLCRAYRDGLNVEIIVVDNNSSDATKHTILSFRDRLPLRYLFEPTVGTYGKSYALNCAIDSGSLGEIVAVLDDDMSPRKDWFKGVADISSRWPDKDLFTGKSYIIWPSEHIPGWAQRPEIRGWVFSVMDTGNSDKPLADGRWFSGNHFWFRSRVLEDGRRFKDIWLTEPDFMLQLVEDGYQGVSGPDAVAGHRIQPQLLDESVVRKRAVAVGRSFAAVRIQPYRSKVNQSVLFKKYPISARLFCLANGLRWRCLYYFSKLYASPDERFVRSMVALERLSTYQELLRVANQMEDYRVNRRLLSSIGSH